MKHECIHYATATTQYEFELPYVGVARLCWDCRRDLALRTLERPFALLPIDCGRIGYKCEKCGGEFTSTDPMTCKCQGRKADCEAVRKAFEKNATWQELTNRWNRA